MNQIIATDLNLSPLSISVIIISGLGFIVMFGIASAKGGYQDLIKTTLENDARQREKK
tara:strand:- start:462 stop:635 length:174 start_codon:yes stop_codon:yes gene_type:complete